VAERESGATGRAVVLASHDEDGLLPAGTAFGIARTPCELAYGREVVCIPAGASAAFPDDAIIGAHGYDSYLAVAMRGADGSALGHVGVTSRTRRLEADEDVRAALAIFAGRAGAELERRRQERDVVDSRARILKATDDERRRIGRDLHDGAQQRLVALGHMLALAQRGLGDVPPEAAALLSQAREQATLAADELRELVHGLHPSGLAEYGLGHALGALAARSPIPVHIGDLPERRLPEPIEIALYYLVSEGLTNAMKHADATEVRVEVAVRDRAVVALVADDGAGGAVAPQGSGLDGLADRIAAVGGRLAIDSPEGGGTCLRATIPVAPYRTAREPFLELGYRGDDGLGERLIAQVIAGRKTVTASPARDWDLGGGPPQIGQRLPVHDPEGRRRTIVEVERVSVLPFAEIGDDVARADGVPDGVTWRAQRQAFYEGAREELAERFGEPGWRLRDDEPMVLVWFALAD
jgi:signal transduction histidine kinase/uncharacterized protein YhfF